MKEKRKATEKEVKRIDESPNAAMTLEMTRVGAPRDLGEFRTPTRIALTNDIRHP
jgi:hypothetical protein